MNDDRFKKASKNVKYSIIFFVCKTILTFFARMIFIRTLGSVMLGVNGLFTNILSMLSLAELGISFAVGYNLYHPLSQNNYKRISSIMSFYRKAYFAIGCTVLTAGSILALFLPAIISNFSEIDNPYLIYFIFLLNTVLSYFIAYKEVLATADQKNYLITRIQGISDIIMNLAQIALLLLTKNYILYLVTQIAFHLVYRTIINRVISKKYPEVDFYTKDKLRKEDKETIKTNVKAMFLHKIGDYCVNGTDNLIISAFINISMVGIYSNYVTIITLLTTLMTLIFNSIISTIGNIMVTEIKEKQYASYKKLDVVGYFIVSYITIILFVILNDFIRLWAGDGYVLDFWVVLLIIFNFYLVGMRIIINAVKSAAGMYKIDRFVPLLQSLVNLVVSLALVNNLGILGVIIGTVVSSILVPMIIRPYLVFKYVFEKQFSYYLRRHIIYASLVVAICLIMFFIGNIITIDSLILKIIVKGLVATVFYSAVVGVVFYKDEAFLEVIKKIKRNK